MDLTYLSAEADGVGTFSIAMRKIGCQGFCGPFPSAFLDKQKIKNWRKGKS
jgi:hypothetical protein